MKKISLEEALEQMLLQGKGFHRNKGRVENISIYDCVDHVLAEDVTAQRNQPPFARSAMDGYAICSSDCEGASIESPVHLKVMGKAFAGEAPKKLDWVVKKRSNSMSHECQQNIRSEWDGTAIRIMTGAVIPEGADCVVKQEDTDYGEDVVSVYYAGTSGENCCPVGEDFKIGEKLAEQGAVIDAHTAAIAAADGRIRLKVYQSLKVALVCTGDELCQPGEKLGAGMIYDSNMIYLSSRLKQLGCEIVGRVAVRDAREELLGALKSLGKTADLIITTGGVSVGQKDLLPEVMKEIGNIVYHGIAVKPGMPTLFSMMQDRPVVSLSGNPYAASAIFELLCVPMIWAMQGRKQTRLQQRTAVFEEGFEKGNPLPRILRGYYNGITVTASAQQKNGQIKAGVGSNCLIYLPAGDKGVKAGQQVKIFL